jgi:hypothetical protein
VAVTKRENFADGAGEGGGDVEPGTGGWVVRDEGAADEVAGGGKRTGNEDNGGAWAGAIGVPPLEILDRVGAELSGDTRDSEALPSFDAGPSLAEGGRGKQEEDTGPCEEERAAHISRIQIWGEGARRRH